ncbi:MAG: hypothetical protein Q4C91_15870 [Eubacteriales bacterium]|nr:hypothetical protein [Eubacteriales bacterium]
MEQLKQLKQVNRVKQVECFTGKSTGLTARELTAGEKYVQQ